MTDIGLLVSAAILAPRDSGILIASSKLRRVKRSKFANNDNVKSIIPQVSLWRTQYPMRTVSWKPAQTENKHTVTDLLFLTMSCPLCLDYTLCNSFICR